MQIADLRVQSTVPTNLPASSSVVGLFINATSGLETIDYLGKRRWVGGQASGSFTDLQVATGGVATLWTGAVFGGAGAMKTGLANPTQWIPFIASNGNVLAIPAYALR